MQKVFKIMSPPQNPIILVPKVSPSEKLTKKFNVRYRAKPAEVYVVAVLSERLPKKCFGFKTMLAML